MDIKSKEGCYYIVNENQDMVAHIDYHFDSQARMVVTSTYVHPSLRGQGIANRLMEKIIALAIQEKRFIIPICSFAAKVLSQPAYIHLKDPTWRA